MPLTSSLDIVDIVSENIGLLTTSFLFMSAEQWERNEDDDSVCPFAYLERPLNYSVDPVHNARIENHKIKILFCGAQLELEAPITDSGPVMLLMRASADEFIFRLSKDSRIVIEGDFQITEALGIDDRNAYGVLVEGSVKVVKNSGYC